MAYYHSTLHRAVALAALLAILWSCVYLTVTDAQDQDCYGVGLLRSAPGKPCTCDAFSGFYGKAPFCKWCGRFASYVKGKCECQAGYVASPKACKQPGVCPIFYDAFKLGSKISCKCRQASGIVPLTASNKASLALGPYTPTCACDTTNGFYPSYQPYAASRSPCTLCFDEGQVVVQPKAPAAPYCGCKKGFYRSLGTGPACRPCTGKNEVVGKDGFCRCKSGYYINTGVLAVGGKETSAYCVACTGKGVAANSKGQCDCDFKGGYYQNGDGYPCYTCNSANAIKKVDFLKRTYCTCKAGYWGVPSEGCQKCPADQTSTPCGYEGCFATCTCKDPNAIAFDSNTCTCKPGYTKDRKGICKADSACSTGKVKVTAWEGSQAAAAYSAANSDKALAKLKTKGPARTFKASAPWKFTVEKNKSPTFYPGLRAPFAAKIETCSCYKTGSIELVASGLAAKFSVNGGSGKFLGNDLSIGFKSGVQKTYSLPFDFYERVCNKVVLWIFVKSAPASIQVNVFELV